MRRAAGALHLIIMVRAIVLGAVLGIVNVVALTQLYALVGIDPKHAGFVLAYGAPPSILFGAIFGLIASALASRRPATRQWLLCTLAFLGVIAVGTTMNRSGFILPALLPTLSCTLLLEWWSRIAPSASSASSAPSAHDTSARQAVHLALLLGAATMLVELIAVGVVAPYGHRPFEAVDKVIEIYLPFGLLIGMLFGMPFGSLAHSTRAEPVWVRRLVLVVLAAELVFVLGTLCAVSSLIAPAMIPAIAACLILEAQTRADPRLPRAEVRSAAAPVSQTATPTP